MEYITKYDSPNFTRAQDSVAVFGTPRVVSGITLHHWDDPKRAPTFAGTINWLLRPGGDSSAHIVAEAGRAAWLVDAKDVAWHCGGLGNPRTIGLEMNPRAWTSDYETAAEIVADIRNVYGDIMLFSHDYWANTQCPGLWDVHRVDRLSYKYLRTKYGKTF